MLGIQGFHTVDKSLLEVLLGNGETLYLLQSAGLLFSLATCNLESLIFGLDSCNLSLYFLLPAIALLVESLVGAILETPNFLQFCFLFYF